MNKSISEKPSGEMPLGFYFSVPTSAAATLPRKLCKKFLTSELGSAILPMQTKLGKRS
jgi:hypothetical protein